MQPTRGIVKQSVDIIYKSKTLFTYFIGFKLYCVESDL